MTTPTAPRPRRLLPLVLGALVLASAVVVGVLGWQSLSDSRAQQARAEAMDAARTQTVEVLSYDPQHVDADLARARQLVSGAFAAKFNQLATGVIEPATKQQGLSTTAKVVRAAVIDSQPEELHALLFVSQTTKSNAQPQPATATNQVKVTMTKADGHWLISDLQPL